MSKNGKLTERKNKKENSDSDQSDSEDVSRKSQTGKKSKTKWSGIFLLALFVIPTLIGGWITAMDYLYPEVFL